MVAKDVAGQPLDEVAGIVLIWFDFFLFFFTVYVFVLTILFAF